MKTGPIHLCRRPSNATSGADQFDEVEVVNLFQQMRAADFSPDSITILSLSQSFATGKNSSFLKVVHSWGIRAGVEADISVANTWIAA
ncbi:hypothetical protein ACLOJK_020624 [Asimina triloba]